MKVFSKYMFALFLLIGLSVSAQEKYFLHTLKSGETLSALAKKYNTTVSNIMRLNGMHANSKLIYGSQIKISGIDKTLAVPATQEATIEDSIGIKPNITTHTVAKGETLFSISKQYNVSVDDIKKWNNILGNSLAVGDKLSIGEDKKAIINTDADTSEQKINDSNNEEKVQAVVPETSRKKEKRKREIPQPIINDFPVFTYSGKGFFEKEFKGNHGNNAQGLAMSFKTQSGWNDGRFYILINELQPETIVKIEAENGKIIYAKVLMGMEDIKENKGILFRLSNAAEAALGMVDLKFSITVSW